MELVKPLLPPNPYLQSLKLDCGQLNDSSIELLLRPSLQELCLHNCADFSGKLLSEIGSRCKDVRYISSFELRVRISFHGVCEDTFAMLDICLVAEKTDVRFIMLILFPLTRDVVISFIC